MKSLSFTLAVFGLVLSHAAQASYLESCTFEAEVSAIQRIGTLNGSNQSNPENDTYHRLATIRVTRLVSDNGSHSEDACLRQVGQSTQLLIQPGETYSPGQKLTLNYFYGNGRAPGGIAQWLSWTVVGSRL